MYEATINLKKSLNPHSLFKRQSSKMCTERMKYFPENNLKVLVQTATVFGL